MKAGVFVFVAVVLAACEFNLTSPTPGNQSSATTTNVTVTQPPPTGGTGPTTTIPGQTQPLPLPVTAQATVAAVAAANPQLIAQSCQTVYGEAAWAYVNLVVDTLRATDTRWGYACRPNNCTAPIEDSIAYFGAVGQPTTGALGIHVVDIIGGWCGTPTATYLVIPYNAAGAWTSRGRF